LIERACIPWIGFPPVDAQWGDDDDEWFKLLRGTTANTILPLPAGNVACAR
jgi:hypothetical protein